ncbi:hypothetical protein [Shimia sp.]|uniref:hypothetical protein n=1 Tax=Shimia sp. TaxID=1954381 RepID=UPI00329A6C5B
MTLKIKIEMDGKLIAAASLDELSQIGGNSTYAFEAVATSDEGEQLCALHHKGQVPNFLRARGVWALVGQIALSAAQRQQTRPGWPIKRRGEPGSPHRNLRSLDFDHHETLEAAE